MPYIYVEDEPQNDITQPSVRLTGTDGNIFNLIGLCRKAMFRYKKEIDNTYNAEYMYKEMFDEIQQGDYDNALQVMMSYCNVT